MYPPGQMPGKKTEGTEAALRALFWSLVNPWQLFPPFSSHMNYLFKMPGIWFPLIELHRASHPTDSTYEGLWPRKGMTPVQNDTDTVASHTRVQNPLQCRSQLSPPPTPGEVLLSFIEASIDVWIFKGESPLEFLISGWLLRVGVSNKESIE